MYQTNPGVDLTSPCRTGSLDKFANIVRPKSDNIVESKINITMSNLTKLYQIQELINKPLFGPELNEFIQTLIEIEEQYV